MRGRRRGRYDSDSRRPVRLAGAHVQKYTLRVREARTRTPKGQGMSDCDQVEGRIQQLRAEVGKMLCAELAEGLPRGGNARRLRGLAHQP